MIFAFGRTQNFVHRTNMIQTLKYGIYLPTRIIADFRLSTRFYIFEHKNIFAFIKRILGFQKKTPQGKKQSKKLSSLTSHIQKFMDLVQFQKYFTQPPPPNPNIKAVKKSLHVSLLEIYSAKQRNLHDNFDYCAYIRMSGL